MTDTPKIPAQGLGVREVFEPEPWFRMTVSTLREGKTTLVRQGKTTTSTYYRRVLTYYRRVLK